VSVGCRAPAHQQRCGPQPTLAAPALSRGKARPVQSPLLHELLQLL